MPETAKKSKFFEFLDKFKDLFTVEVEHTTGKQLTPVLWGFVGVLALFAIGFITKKR